MAWDALPRDAQEQRGFDLLGAQIRRKRLSLGWTQRRLEAYSGIDQTVISRIENGKQYGLRWVRLARLVEALDGLEPGRAEIARPIPTRSPPTRIDLS